MPLPHLNQLPLFHPYHIIISIQLISKIASPNLLHSSKWQIKTTENTICFSLDMFRLNTQSSSVESNLQNANIFERIERFTIFSKITMRIIVNITHQIEMYYSNVTTISDLIYTVEPLKTDTPRDRPKCPS